MAQNFRELVVWRRAIELTVSVYKLTRSFLKDEQFGLISQMRRASVSVASNVAKGRGRLSVGEFRQFLGLAQGSLFELKTQLVAARKLEFGERKVLDDTESLAEEVSKMLAAFIQTLGTGAKRLKSESL